MLSRLCFLSTCRVTKVMLFFAFLFSANELCIIETNVVFAMEVKNNTASQPLLKFSRYRCCVCDVAGLVWSSKVPKTVLRCAMTMEMLGQVHVRWALEFWTGAPKEPPDTRRHPDSLGRFYLENFTESLVLAMGHALHALQKRELLQHQTRSWSLSLLGS